MAVVDVKNTNAEKISELDLPDAIFKVPVKASVLHEVVKMQLACRRTGTAAVKHRSDVRGSSRKLFRQKGTGRARRGDKKSPLLRGGGSVFGPDPRSFAYRIPLKVRRLGIKMALSSKLNENMLIILDRIELGQIKTKNFIHILERLEVNNALIVTEQRDTILELSARNVPSIKILRSEGLNVYDILRYEILILLQASIKPIEERLCA